jgi:hypothetical protein
VRRKLICNPLYFSVCHTISKVIPLGIFKWGLAIIFAAEIASFLASQ